LVIINAEPTAFDRQAAAVINAPLAEVLPELVRQI